MIKNERRVSKVDGIKKQEAYRMVLKNEWVLFFIENEWFRTLRWRITNSQRKSL